MQRGSLMENYAIRKLQEQIICQVFDLPSQHCNTLSLPPHLIAKHRECRRRRYAPLMPPNLVAMCNHSLPISPCYVIVLEFDLVCLKKTLFGLFFQWEGVGRLQLRKLGQSIPNGTRCRGWGEVGLLVAASQVHPRCADAHNCLGPTLGRWWNTGGSFIICSLASLCQIS